ncbi:RagB/SusD family nutrient uptake outer membrane protein [Maribacter sp. 2307ULW6-5]|uniref:RagB/SusD family nutrient uptake outer membrane protein n=1 Tax=Maribacter sp. 2307ULW6-5 TaxID=3386275 RepID=UPI0039BC50F4
MKKTIYLVSALLALGLASCINDLETTPEVELTLEEVINRDPNAVEGIVSRLYASFALSGPDGPGSSDISDDAGESPFLRGIINLQDFTADGMKNRWGDDGLDQLTTASNWDSNNKFFRYLYNRAYYTIPQTNNLLNVLQTVDVPEEDVVAGEARFLRALAYYYLIDGFGKGVLVTEADFGETDFLPEASRTELFNYVEGELLEIEPLLPESNDYGRVNRYVVNMLLAKLYLNAEVYTGTARWDDALIHVERVINGPYTLDPNFVRLFSGDNDASPEIIFPLIADPLTSQSFGNTTYIVNGNLSPDTMEPIAQFGALQGWQGHRATKAWYGLYGDLETSTDDRAELFWTEGHNFEMENYRTWTDGYPSIKFRNAGFNTELPATDFSGTDFPLYRLADAYLMYAELALRGAAGADISTALGYVNQVRERSNAAPIATGDLDLDFIIDERARELNLEGHRRTDLIRFGRFTGADYLWPWKGNTVNGSAIPEHYKLFPIPELALQGNPNLTQNPGY